MSIAHAAVGLLVAPAVLPHPPAVRPPVVTKEGREQGRRDRGGRPAVLLGLHPLGDPDPVGHHVTAGLEDPGVVERPDPGGGARVDAGDVAEAVQHVGPGGEEGQRGLAAADVADVVGLDVVPERAPGSDAQRLRPGHGVLCLQPALLAGGRVVVGRVRVDPDLLLRVDVAACLRADRDRQEAPAVAQLGGDPLGGELGLLVVAAVPVLPGDVDAHRPVRRRGQPGVHDLLRLGRALVERVPGEVAWCDPVRRLRRGRGEPAGQDGCEDGESGEHDGCAARATTGYREQHEKTSPFDDWPPE